MAKWTSAEIPSQKGRLAVITGAAGGLGYETSLALAQPNGIFELKGRVAPAVVSPKAKEVAVARRIGEASEELTGVRIGGRRQRSGNHAHIDRLTRLRNESKRRSNA